MFQIVVKEFKEFIREKTNMFFFLAFPVGLIFLLGNLLLHIDRSEEPIGVINIHYQLQTVNAMQNEVIHGFIDSFRGNKSIHFTSTDDLEAAKQLAGKNEIAAVVVFEGDPLQINIYEGKDNIKNRTVAAVMNGFARTGQAINSVLQTAPQVLPGLKTEQEAYVEQKDLGVNRSMIDYYAVSMMAMISFMSMLAGSAAFVGERQNKTINRLIIAPQNRAFLFLQKILGMMPQVAMQIMIIMVISVFVFHAHYAVDFTHNLYLFFMFFLVTLASISIGAVLGLIMKGNPTVIIMPVLWVMMFFGGTFSKEINVKGVTSLLPSYQLQQAAFDLTLFRRFDKANAVVIISVVILIIALILGAAIFSKKEEE